MPTALVTGGAGFLGRHLCARLLADGYDVLCLDNFTTGTRDNLTGLAEHPRLRAMVHDVCRPFQATADYVFNLACPASPIHYQRDPLQTVKTSVLGALHALDLATRNGARVLQASTSEVYGDPHEHPQQERYWGHVNPVGPRACYDEGKRCAETLSFDYHRRHGTRIKVVRIFNTYGPYMQPDDGRVISNFIVQALRGEPLTIYGRGEQTRSFCYVDDLVEGLMRMMASPDAMLGPVNLGNPHENTVGEVAERIRALTGSRSRIVFRPLPADDPRQRKPDITAAREQLGWEPRVALDEGLRRTIDYFDAKLRHAKSANETIAS